MLKNLLFFSLILLLFSSACTKSNDSNLKYSKYVDPIIGTASDGHTFPGVVAPFGMIQLSPDTRINGDNCASGYHYLDSSILGFSHTHYSGTGRGAGGDILFMPTTGKIQLNSGDSKNTKSGYRSAFSHQNESATAGYYKVVLEDYGIMTELTSSKRVGFHKYTFSQKDTSNIILDLTHGIKDHPDSLFIKIIGKNKIVGMRKSIGGLRDFQTLYFAAEFSEDFNQYGISVNGKINNSATQISGKDIKAFFRFKKKKVVMVKVAISKVDIEGASKNLKEIEGWNFDQVKTNAQNAWEKELKKLAIKSKDSSNYKIFYTALYHSCIMPSLDTDIDGRYRSTNHKIYTAKGFKSYTNFSLWDTFRALHPLMTIINQSKTEDFIKTFIERFEHSGTMPIFELSGNDLLVMIGYHSLPVIADAYVKGIRNYDVKKAINGMKSLGDIPFEERNEYKTFGYIPYDYTDQAVSRSLEFAFDDWSLAQVAKGIENKTYLNYSNRANFYKNLYHKKSGFTQAKNIKGQWITDFDPLAYTRKYTQGNAWQYTTFVLQDINEIVRMMGGDKKFEHWLDNYFTIKNNKTYQSRTSSLMIGQYYHGNEPSHHTAYLYNYVGTPWKTQQMVRKILETQYTTSPDGLAGNDDAGQMSAWYVLSAMGFYSVTPGMDYYVIGSPLFDEVEMHLENHNIFKIITKNNSPKNVYIQSVKLNGKPYSKSYLKQKDIMNGGTMEFIMNDKPNINWANSKYDRPYSTEFKDVSMPQLRVKGKNIGRDGVVTFEKEGEVLVTCLTKKANIYYTIDGSEPDSTSIPYKKDIKITNSCTLKVKAFKKGYFPSYTATIKLRNLSPLPAMVLNKVKQGIHFSYREVALCKSVAQIDQYKILRNGVMPKISSETKFNKALNYALVFKGYLDIPKTGIYTFYADTEYAASFWIDGTLIASNESTDWLGERSGTIALQKGLHAILLKKFQVGGETKMKFMWKGPNMEKEEVPANVYFYQ